MSNSKDLFKIGLNRAFGLADVRIGGFNQRVDFIFEK
jgi:hypothetical protein